MLAQALVLAPVVAVVAGEPVVILLLMALTVWFSMRVVPLISTLFNIMYLLFNDTYGHVSIVQKNTYEECVTAAELLGLVEDQYAIFPNLDDLPNGWQNFPTGVTLTLGLVSSYGYNLDFAKQSANNIVNSQSNEQAKAILAGLSYDVYVAQVSLPAEQRIVKYQAVMDANNALAIETENREQAIAAATTIDEINNIVNPPTGIINIGRGSAGPLDLNNSYYTEFNSTSMTEAETELYVPGTTTVIPYGSIPYGFDSIGNCFAVGDYLIQIREVATGSVIAEFECPLAPANVDVAF